jgi:divalent metal cation (Fe/Co/Zn/Cd) transporter
MTELPLLQVQPVTARSERERLMRRARALAWGANLWHVIEFAIAVGAGVAAGSIALIGFGLDSLVEVAAGTVIVWLFTGRRIADSERAERRAQQLIAISFYLLGAYIAIEAGRDLIGGNHPAASWIGIGLAAVTAPTMPLLARAKQRIGHQLGSSATVSEGAQNMLCAYLSVALLIGLGANALSGVAMREGRQSWRGDACGCCAPTSPAPLVDACRDGCCDGGGNPQN